MTFNAVLDLLDTDDLIAIGMRADAVRKVWHPEGLVTYSSEPPVESADAGELVLAEEDVLERLADTAARQYRIVRLKFSPAKTTAVEALKLIALARIYLEDVPEMEIPGCELGLKFCQIALRFGANDLGCIAGAVTEEQLVTVIREAGFIPKKRSGTYRAYELS